MHVLCFGGISNFGTAFRTTLLVLPYVTVGIYIQCHDAGLKEAVNERAN